jgi:hypothetical protein
MKKYVEKQNKQNRKKPILNNENGSGIKQTMVQQCKGVKT